MPTVTLDLINGEKYTRDKDGGKYTRVFHVTGLSGAASQMLYAAQQACGVDYYFPHPDIPGLFASHIEAVPFPANAKTSAKVTALYTTMLGVRFKIGATAQQGKTRIDKDGKYLNVSYTTDPQKAGAGGFSGSGFGGDGAAIVKQAVEIPVLFPGLTITFTREEPIANAARVLPFLRCLNASAFQGAPAGSWLCREICAESLNNGASADFSYTFEYKPPLPGANENSGTNWNVLTVFVDQHTRKVPDNIDPFDGVSLVANGWSLFAVYPLIDFGPLNLPVIIG